MRTLRILVLATLLTASTTLSAQTPKDNTMHPIRFSRPVIHFINHMVKTYHFNRSSLVALFKSTQYNPTVIEKITYPYEKKPWNIYRGYFLTPSRITKGAAYWTKHETVLNEAQQRYGVDPSVIVAIIGMETNYGANKGHFYALNALSTLAFYYPPRSKFFKSELTQLLLLARDQGIRANHIKSSYAGAIGIPQFMPSTYRHYAVSYNNQRAINLTSNDNDAIMSVANYLSKSGWTKGQPVATSAVSYQPPSTQLVSKTPKLKDTVGELKKQGIHPETTVPNATQTSLVDLVSENDHHEYWFVFHNFNAIMRYNPRITYAMAVYQLSHAIRATHEKNRNNTRQGSTA